jgi:protein-S-isoprenylcysteine O-methyltransferase Ste14
MRRLIAPPHFHAAKGGFAMRRETLRPTALVLCAVFALAVAFSIGIQLLHANHHCADGKCPICVAYQGAQFVMRVMGLVAVASAMHLMRRVSPRVSQQPGCPVLLSTSPVSLNIRMND